MVANVSLPAVVLFLEGTDRLEMFQKIVSGLQRGGRRVYVFVGGGRRSAMRPSILAVQESLPVPQAKEWPL